MRYLNHPVNFVGNNEFQHRVTVCYTTVKHGSVFYNTTGRKYDRE